MSEQSSRFTRVAAIGAVAVAFAIGGVAATGCGSDEETDSVNNAIDSVQSQAKSVQSQISTAVTGVQDQAQSVESQIQSVQSQIQTQTQSSGGSSDGGNGY